jgi:hypothetical protein
MRTIAVTRYITPLREGGSLPAIIEADDDGMYVLKFHGAGQGARALIAELIVGKLALACSLPMPEIVFASLNSELGRSEPDAEIQDLIRASTGQNLAIDYLPGSITFDPGVDVPDADLASSIVWFDAYTTNIDRTIRNTNMLMWQRRLWIIDHGAALYFHHSDNYSPERSQDRFPMIRDHVLLPHASSLREIDAKMASKLSPTVIRKIVEAVPDNWLERYADSGDAHSQRERYIDYLVKRLEGPRAFVEEAISARATYL